MEQLAFSLSSARFSSPAASDPAPALVGVVGSGNLEVLVERGATPDGVEVSVSTSAHGFAPTWEAVLTDFSRDFAVGGLRFSLNDHAATPAVVSLRLRQALEQFSQ